MTSTPTLGKPLVVLVLDGDCPGDCGGTIRVVTDLYEAYAETINPADDFFVGGETEVIDFEVDTHRVLVNCASIGKRPHTSCDGHLAFEPDAFEWVAAASIPDASYMKRLHRAGDPA